MPHQNIGKIGKFHFFVFGADEKCRFGYKMRSSRLFGKKEKATRKFGDKIHFPKIFCC